MQKQTSPAASLTFFALDRLIWNSVRPLGLILAWGTVLGWPPRAPLAGSEAHRSLSRGYPGGLVLLGHSQGVTSGRLQEPANGARGGHPRTVPYSKMSSKGRTELQISLSRAKNVEEAAGDIRFCVFPQKTGENAEKQIFSSKIFEIFRKCPNASERIQVHPNASERIRMHPNRSEQV